MRVPVAVRRVANCYTPLTFTLLYVHEVGDVGALERRGDGAGGLPEQRALDVGQMTAERVTHVGQPVGEHSDNGDSEQEQRRGRQQGRAPRARALLTAHR